MTIYMMEKLMTDNEINLPLLETVKRSFYFVFSRLSDCAKASSFWFWLVFIEILLGYPSLSGSMDTAQNMIKLASSLLISVASAGIGAEICRNIIAKDNTFAYFKPVFTERSLRYWGYNILIVFMIIVPFVLLASLIFYGFGLELYSRGIMLILLLLSISACAMVGCRLYLTLPAQAMDDQTMSLKLAWRLTKGNAFKVFMGIILMSIPGFLAAVILGTISAMIPGFDSNSIWKILFTFLTLAISFFDACAKASFLSHLYQYFTFYADKISEAE